MRSALLCSLVWVLAATPLLAQSPGSAAPAQSPSPAPTTLRWSQGDPNSELTSVNGVRILVLHSPRADVAVHLGDLQEYATRAWVDILNRGPEAITIDPSQASLEILKPKRKLLSPIAPEKLAESIKKRADVDAAQRAGAGCPYLTSGCAQNSSGVASSKDVQQVADSVVEDVRSSAWRLQSLKPLEQAHGAIFFPFEHKREECALRVPVAGLIFEFPACRPGGKD